MIPKNPKYMDPSLLACRWHISRKLNTQQNAYPYINVFFVSVVARWEATASIHALAQDRSPYMRMIKCPVSDSIPLCVLPSRKNTPQEWGNTKISTPKIACVIEWTLKTVLLVGRSTRCIVSIRWNRLKQKTESNTIVFHTNFF